MVTVVTNWIGGQAPTVRSDRSGLYATRSYLIKGLTGTPGTRLVDSLSVTGIPDIGDSHPATGTLIVDSLQPRLVQRDPQYVEVVANYWRPTTTGFDPDNPKTTDPVYVETQSQYETVRDVEDATGASTDPRLVDRPAIRWTVEASVSGGAGQIEDLNRTYANKVNSVAARFDSSAATKWAIHTVRCDGFEAAGSAVAGREVNRIMGLFTLAPKWEDTSWGWRFPVGTTSYTFDKIYVEANLINSGFMVS